MSCPHCDGSGWIYTTDRAGNTALKACECRKQRLAPDPEGTDLTDEVAAVQVGILCSLLGFAPQGAAQAVIVTAMVKMCSTREQLAWLVNRAAELYSTWPGIPALRQILCSKYKPKDGIESSWSETFPEGLPDSVSPPVPLLPLPEGVKASLDAVIERDVSLSAEALGPRKLYQLPPLSPAEEMRRREFDRELSEVITAPGVRELPPVLPNDLLFQEMGAFCGEDATDGRREIALSVLARYRSQECVRSFVNCERLVLKRENVTEDRLGWAERAVRRLSDA